MLSPEFIQKMKTKLEAEKAEVAGKISKFSGQPDLAVNPDLDDLAQEATDRALNDTLLSTHKSILERIERALAKIANGKYGLCEKCGTEIAMADLEKEPWAELCSLCRNAN